MTIRLALGGLVALAMLLIAPQLSKVAAQYPQPAGSLDVEVSSSTAVVGGSVQFTFELLDVDGNPFANRPCSAAIFSQPGTDASIVLDSPTTDENGVLTGTLFVGTTPGAVAAHCACGSARYGIFVSVVADAAIAPPVTPPITPPEALPPMALPEALPPITAPVTGFGPTQDDGGAGHNTLVIAILASVGALLVLAGAGAAARRQTRRG